MALPKPQLNEDVLAYDELQTDEINAQIITSGSNTNGRWVKFPDGTMECTHDVTVLTTELSPSSVSGKIWTFPLPFFDVPQIFVGVTVNSGAIATVSNYVAAGGYRDKVNSNFMTTHLNRNSTSANVVVNLLAKGKWK